MRTHRARALLAAALAGVTLTACGGGHSDHNSDSAAQSTGQTPGASSHAGMNMADVKGDGLAAEVEGYTISDVSAPTTAGKAGKLEFTILGPDGKPQKEFLLELTKLMHTYVVRKDLTEFQHVHPELDEKTGRWSIPMTIDKPGPYRVVAEFQALKPDGFWDQRVLGKAFTVEGDYKPVPYSPKLGTVSQDGYELTLDKTVQLHGPDMTLKVTKGGADVTDLEPYLQSFAHVTGFRKDDLKVVHMHPNQSPGEDQNARGGPTLNLMSMFKEAGKYRLFVQFQTAGTLHTVPIDVDVMDHQMDGSAPAGGASSSPTASATPAKGDSMAGMTAEEHEKAVKENPEHGAGH